MSAVPPETPRASATPTEPASDHADGKAPPGPAAADFGPNEWLVDELYQRYLADPGSVDMAWWSFFADYSPPAGAAGPATDAAPAAPAGLPGPRPAAEPGGAATRAPPAATGRRAAAPPPARPAPPARPGLAPRPASAARPPPPPRPASPA